MKIPEITEHRMRIPGNIALGKRLDEAEETIKRLEQMITLLLDRVNALDEEIRLLKK